MSNRPKDSFENWVQVHREAFDVFEPSDNLLMRIEGALPQAKVPKVVPFWAKLRVAAAAVTLLGVGTLAGLLWAKENISNPTLSSISPELARAETYYSQRVAATLMHFEEVAPDQASVPADIKELEKAYDELRQALGSAPKAARATIIRNMIDNYLLRLGILERALQYHQEFSPSVNQKDHKHESL